MPELPQTIPKGPLVAACVLMFVGFVAIIFASGNVLVLAVAALLVLGGGAIGTKIGLDVWKATE